MGVAETDISKTDAWEYMINCEVCGKEIIEIVDGQITDPETRKLFDRLDQARNNGARHLLPQKLSNQ